MRIKELLWDIRYDFLDSILPLNQCLMCDGVISAPDLLSEEVFCQDCREKLAEYRCCSNCAVFLPDNPDKSLLARHNMLCHAPANFGIQAFVAMAPYHNKMRQNILQLKYHQRRRLARPMGREMAKAWRKTNWPADVIIPIPLHAAKLKQRGYNQCDLLARACSRELSIPVMYDVLLRERETAVQNKLNAAERQKNVADAFVCSSAAQQLAGQNIILLDDIITTGSTMFACAAALLPFQPAAIYGLAVAGKLIDNNINND